MHTSGFHGKVAGRQWRRRGRPLFYAFAARDRHGVLIVDSPKPSRIVTAIAPVCRCRYVSVAAIVLLIFAQPSHAYLDPGTGSIVLQGLLASIALALGMLRLYWQRCKTFLLSLVRGGGRADDTKPAESSDSQ